MAWNADRNLAVGGISAATILLVLDKAGKLKGPWLLLLLAVALGMTVPVLFTMPWVAHAPTGLPTITKKLLIVFCVCVVWAVFSVWITSPNTPNSPLAEESIDSIAAPTREISVSAVPHGDNDSELYLEVLNRSNAAKFTARLCITDKSYGEGFKRYAYDGEWGRVPEVKGWWEDAAPSFNKIVQIANGRSALLRIATIHSTGSGISEMNLVGVDESLRWDFEMAPNDAVPFFTLRVEVFEDGVNTPFERIYKVGPKHAYGPLGMAEVAS